MRWLLITYRLPADESRARVAVWREIRRAGALHLQQSVVAFPETEDFRPVVERFRMMVGELGGSTLGLRSEPLAGADGELLVEAWNEARAAEYSELASECEKLVAEIDKEFAKEKFTLAELEEEEAELEKLQRWHARIKGRDVLEAPGADDADAALERATAALERYSAAVFERTAK